MSLSDQYIQKVGNLKVLTLMATEAEYGAKLKEAEVKPYNIGVGPIQAAMNTTKILMTLQRKSITPDLILSIGSAGSATLSQGNVYQVSSVSYRDIDASPFGFEAGVTPFSKYPSSIGIASTIPSLPSASISTGGNVINKQGDTKQTFADINADMVDMETAAVLDVANEFGIPMIGLRGISDGQEDSVGYETWEECLDAIDENLAAVYTNLKQGLKNGTITKNQLTVMPSEYHDAQKANDQRPR